ncbi:MAG: molybdopterin cofactor-binding domain-containing protein [Dehalococcoidales bacterium]
MSQELYVVGKRLPRPDAIEKATGAAKYTVDIKLPGMLIGKVLRSPHPHAMILKVDTSRAESLPGVVAVITREDTPKIRFTRSKGSVTIIKPEKVVEDEMVINDKARFLGEPVAAVAAINEGIANEALELIDVEYAVLPAVFDPVEGMKPGAPRIHDSAENNVAIYTTYIEGDVEKGFQEADCIVEETFQSSKQKVCHLEPSACIASFDKNGRLTVWSPGQHAFPFRRKTSEIFGIPEGKITWITPHVGGAFGNGQSLRAEPICIALAKKAGRPVKLEYTSEEDFVATETRQPCIMTGRIGVKKDGTITALQLKVIGNSGPYLSQCVKTTKVTLVMFGSLYRCPNVYGEGYSIYTNTVNSGGHRGYGAPQAYYVLEQLVDMACEKIGMDPLEFRLKNHRRVGDPSMYSFVSKDEKLGIETRKPMPIESCQLPECIKRGAEQIGWKEKRMAKKEGTIRRGVGMACYIYLSSAFPVDFQHSSVFIKFNEDGSANLVVSACDFGQGILASLAQIAAEELGLRAEDIRITSGNTDITMYDTGQYSSRSCYIIGNSVLGAARLAKQRLLERAAQIIGEPADKLDIKDRQVYVKTAPEKRIPVAEVTWQAMYDADNFSNISAKYAWQPTSNAYPFQAAFAEVEVDTESGQVKLLKIVTGQDIGRAINPITAEGQVQGGGIQAIDMALYSDFVTKPTGELESTNFTNYKVCTTLDIPEFEVILIEEPTPTGPFGAKSVGESGTIAIAPAIYNAIYDAVGVRVKDMPVTPEKIIEGLLALVDQNTG